MEWVNLPLLSSIYRERSWPYVIVVVVVVGVIVVVEGARSVFEQSLVSTQHVFLMTQSNQYPVRSNDSRLITQ